MKIPSLIDMHTHLREPGYTEKETVKTGLEAAYKGGYGAILAMPNTNPVNDNIKTTNFILNKAKGMAVELYPVGAVTYGLNSECLTDFKALKDAGCIAFSNDGMKTRCIKEALMTGELILSHLEDETKECIEQISVFQQVLQSKIKPRLHFCHVSKKSTVDAIRAAKVFGLDITAETCPHYFTLTRDDIDDTGRFKMNPPLGTENDRLAIIEAVKDGTIDVISTDHAPHTKEEKLRPYSTSPNGIVGLETAFGLTYMTFGLELTIEKMAEAPRRILGINPKREIEIDLNSTWVVKGEEFKSMCKITPFENKLIVGKIL